MVVEGERDECLWFNDVLIVCGGVQRSPSLYSSDTLKPL